MPAVIAFGALAFMYFADPEFHHWMDNNQGWVILIGLCILTVNEAIRRIRHGRLAQRESGWLTPS
jgi:hypothetical protein